MLSLLMSLYHIIYRNYTNDEISFLFKHIYLCALDNKYAYRNTWIVECSAMSELPYINNIQNQFNCNYLQKWFEEVFFTLQTKHI